MNPPPISPNDFATAPNAPGTAAPDPPDRQLSAAAADPFAFLRRFELAHWRFVECRFHNACRRLRPQPAEVLAWVRRDIGSDLADLGRWADALGNDPLVEEHRRALISLRAMLERHPAEAAAYAGHVAGVEERFVWCFGLGQKDLPLREGRRAEP